MLKDEEMVCPKCGGKLIFKWETPYQGRSDLSYVLNNNYSDWSEEEEWFDRLITWFAVYCDNCDWSDYLSNRIYPNDLKYWSVDEVIEILKEEFKVV